MTDHDATLMQMTLAVERIEAMVQFYTSVLGADLRPIAAYGTTLYTGTLGGVPITLCPNTIAGVAAEQSRHQLAFAVPDVRMALVQGREAGGAVEDEDADGRRAVVRDPDGNTVELVLCLMEV